LVGSAAAGLDLKHPAHGKRNFREGIFVHSYKYLIIGGGMTSDAAVHGIREIDEVGSIGMISAEDVPPYERPPLTKGLWKGETGEDEIWRGTGDLQVDMHLGRRAVMADVKEKVIYDDQQGEYRYEKLLLATGGHPRKLPHDDDAVIYYRTFHDYQELKERLETGSRCVVLGGGFIGSEIAAALRINGHSVVMVFPENGIGGGTFPPDHAQFLNDYYREQGVEIKTGQLVDRVGNLERGIEVALDSGEKLSADVAIAGLGIEPNTELADDLGLELTDGICVDSALQTSRDDVYAAGDVAAFYNAALGERLRVEHEDNANTMGKMAGRSMAGAQVDYDYLPYFYSDLFEHGYEAVGKLDPSLTLISIWEEPHEKGLIAYMDANQLKGVVLWNLWGKVDAARELIATDRPVSSDVLRSALMDEDSGK
jgi:NADPH-dependent 2,4-dienoyl-CoA reductase/sulfur reductase-like enzyme